jgi:hypothetical protein
MKRLIATIATLLLGVLATTYAGAPAASAKSSTINVSKRAVSTWAKTLNPSGTVPRAGFRAVFFDRSNPGKPPIAADVDAIAIKYAWADFNNIRSEDFGAYWVGMLHFDAPATKRISVSQSWAKSRIMIDGAIVFEGGGKKTIDYEFAKGDHLIEVEYVNNWHTTEFKVTIQDVFTETSEASLSRYFSADETGDARLYYVSLYESAAQDTKVEVVVPRTGKPAIVWLTSYEALDWRISASDPVKAVVLSSYAPGSQVSGVGAAKVFRIRRWPSIHSETKRCSCSGGGTFHCAERSDLLDIADELERVTHRPLAGYVTKYAAAQVTIAPFTPAAARSVTASRVEAERVKQACAARTNPDFDKMFD